MSFGVIHGMKKLMGNFKPSASAALSSLLETKEKNLRDGKAPKNFMLSKRMLFTSRFKYNRPPMVPEIIKIKGNVSQMTFYFELFMHYILMAVKLVGVV